MKQRRKSVQMYSMENEHTDVLKKVKCLCKEFGFTSDMFKSALAEGGRKK